MLTCQLNVELQYWCSSVLCCHLTTAFLKEKSVCIRRKYTIGEKRKMKRERTARNRQLKRLSTAQVIQVLRSDHDKTKKQLCHNQKFAQLYCQERKSCQVPTICVTLLQIPRSALVPNNCDGNVVDRGSFGIVKQMLYKRALMLLLKLLTVITAQSQFYVRPVSCQS